MARTYSRKAATPSKPASRASAASTSARRSAPKAAKAIAVASVVPANAATVNQTIKQRGGSKQAQVLEMLAKPAGATVEAVMKATGWQAHSVRGFFAGIVRKKLKLVLTSVIGDGGRVYKVTGNLPTTSTGSRPKKVAA